MILNAAFLVGRDKAETFDQKVQEIAKRSEVTLRFLSTKSATKGTGLGLWVSLGIIQNHGGQIKVRSRRGRGTTFTIALPLEQTS